MRIKKPNSTILFLVFFCSFSLRLYSQKLDFENIGVRNGLPASEVYHVFEDKYGYIWFFTEFGIVKYTGSRMIPVCTNLSLDQTAIYAVAESPSGNMYISNSKNRIYRIHNDKAYRVRGKELDKLVKKQVPIGELITGLFFDSNGTLWANAIDYTYQFKFSSFRTFGLPEEKPKKVQNFSTFITKSKSSRKLFAVGKTVLEWKEGKVIGSNNRVDTRLFKNLMGNNNCLGRLPSCTGRFGIYCASNSVIQAVNFNGKKFTANLGREILSMNASPNGHIWVGTVRGLVELDRDLKQLNTYFDNLAISDVIFDRSNGMWVTTIGYGIFHCDNVDQLSYSNVIKKDERISTLKVLDKQLLIGTYSGKVFFNDRNGLYKMQIPENLIGINDVVKVRGTYYLGTMSGIFRFTDKNDFSEVYKKHAFTNYGIANYDDQNLIIISGQAIGRYEMETGEFYFFKTGKSRGALKRVNGEVLSVTDLGVAVVHINGVKFPDYLKSLKSLPITQMRLDWAGNVWFCAKDQGLYRLDQKNKITHIKLPASTIVKNILFVSNGAVIVATNQGAFVTDLKGLRKQESWRKIIKDEITAIEEYDNKVYFGSKTGLFSIANSRLKLTTSPAFFLRTIRTSKDTLSKNQHVLERNQNELVFHYDYLDFRQKTRMLCYHLKGPAPENGIVNGTEVHLQNLDPGDYTLETYPVIDGRGENEKKIITRFTIKPAVWETFTFQIIMLLLFSLVIVLIYRWILSRKLKQKKARESMERMLTEYRLTALKSQINPHFMSNSLVAIQNLILQNDTDSANLYIAKFSLLLRSLLDYSNKSAASLKSELAMIELYVELEQLRFSNKFEFKIDIASDVDVNDTFIPTLITQPFIENAIWHGLLPLSNETAAKLTLGVRMNNRSLIISIIDNGVGRGYHKDKRIARVSKGTELIAARIETLNQLYETTGGKIEITDLKDENGMPLGTLVTIELPESILNELYEDKES